MPIISISRGSYGGGTGLAKALRERLGWRVLSMEVLHEAAEHYGVSEEDLQRALDYPANFYERLTHKKRRFILATQAVLGELLADGNGIYHGLGGAFIFEDLCNLYKVRVVAPIEQRVEARVSEKKVTRDEALRYIRDADERRGKWVRQIFGVDWNDPKIYDLVIDLAETTIEQAADVIAAKMISADFQPTPKCVEEFNGWALMHRVRAELYFNSSFPHEIAHVSAQGGTVRLTGGRDFETTKTAVVNFVREIPGVEMVVTEDDPEGMPGIPITTDQDSGLNSLDTKARNVMLPPTSYPHLHQDVSIRDAIVAVSASSVKLDDGYFLAPRYVLILDDEERLVGVVSRRDLLKGLLPQFRESKVTKDHIQELVPYGGITPSEIAISWTSLFTHRAIASSYDPVRTVMNEVRASAGLDDSLSTVISTALFHGVDLIPVLDGDRVAGVVVMTNIFDLVAQFIIEHGAKAE
jgi:cytidylate kinase/predicted transcriptional regulator